MIAYTTYMKRGFTLMEVLISMGILVILLGVSTPFVLHFYRRYILDSERGALLTLMRRARTMSMAGTGSSDHGVHIASDQFTLFEGSSYAMRNQSKDQTFSYNDIVVITGQSDILFKYLSGESSSTSFRLDNGNKQSSIYVNTEGRIDWE